MGKRVYLRYGGKPEITTTGIEYSRNIYDRNTIYDFDNDENMRKLKLRALQLLVEGYSCQFCQLNDY